jgi:hypothetical protein
MYDLSMKEKARHGRTLEIAVALLAALVIGHSSFTIHRIDFTPAAVS